MMRPIYDRARASKVNVGALINSVCDIIDANEDEIVFGFKYPNHVKTMSDPANLAFLTETVVAVMGRPVRVRCVVDDNVESWQRRDSASRSALVRAAQEMGARVLSSGPEE